MGWLYVRFTIENLYAAKKLSIYTTLQENKSISHCNNGLLFFQETPLHIVAKEGYEHTVRYLCKYGADTTLKDNNGVSRCDYID